MRTFILVSKGVRNQYKQTMPFIAAMCKMPQREDVLIYLRIYLKHHLKK